MNIIIETIEKEFPNYVIMVYNMVCGFKKSRVIIDKKAQILEKIILKFGRILS